jgi:uncharacterized protein (DUF1501 family)
LPGAGTAPQWLLRAAAQGAQGKAGRKILVAIFQRGAADGLNVVVPFFEPRYYQLRPSIAIPQPGKPNGAIDLDGRFALHPALQPLKAMWDSRQLAIVHSAGSHDPSRSHFDAQEFMECGTPGVKREDGWLNRALTPVVPDSSPVRAIASGAQLPKTLQGSRGAIAVDGLPKFQVADKTTAGMLEHLYATSLDAQLKAQGEATFDAVKLIESIRTRPYTPVRRRAVRRRLRPAAAADRAPDQGRRRSGSGLCRHRRLGPPQQRDRPADESAASVRILTRRVHAGPRRPDGRRGAGHHVGVRTTAAENGNAGTDHGHGNVMMVLGGGVRGGRLYGDWPGLEPEQLYERRDLAVTTDFRDVLGEVVSGHLSQKVDQVFPGYTPKTSLGLLTA